eukprot:gnl/TRDRNA2_/TRDRNA2_183445_c0_seq1.p1 gnl/TRDRNA2_/TRDRNA2_183445_c0~~gnl/TRDRNA2_/TRDRNA2_183445_c0_seq1.p1  ORF type:complete len:355 (-),score=74.70 gnl/TRDRNA2_/TRDRNA2_183445_c0_seq1:223-1170(-)
MAGGEITKTPGGEMTKSASMPMLSRSGSGPIIRDGTLPRMALSFEKPALAAAYDLRGWSLMRKRIADEERPSSATITLQKYGHHNLSEIDLLGGNGFWRQKKAKVEWERRRIVAEEEEREKKRKEEIRLKRKQEREARLRRLQEEEDRRRQELKERQQREEEEREKRRREEEAMRRAREEEEERQWQIRQPKICEPCAGVGKCTICLGKGYLFSTFLKVSVTGETVHEAGKLLQGCEGCGGCSQNVDGAMQYGSGLCLLCHGKGKVLPRIAVDKPIKNRRSSLQPVYGGVGQTGEDMIDSGPPSPASPKTTFAAA